MTTVKIIETYRELKEAIAASKMNFGLSYYPPSLLREKERLLKKTHSFHVLESGEVAYVSYFRNNRDKTRYGILHKFSWDSCLCNSPAAIVTFDHEPNGDRFIQIGNYEFNRDDLRGDGYIWTTDSF